MKKIFISTTKVILITALALFFAKTPVVLAQDVDASMPKLSNTISNPKLSVSIPGFAKFRSITCSITIDEQNKQVQECKIPWLADYINALYKYGISALMILAVIVIMIAGVIWITSGGDSKKIADAKSWIGGSLLGVLIAVSAFMILNIVNPALTTLSPLKIKTIQKKDVLPIEDLTPEEQTSAQNISAPIGKTSFGEGTNGVPLIMQCKDPVRSIPYGAKGNRSGCGSTICSSGCGVASLGMVIFKFQKESNFNNVVDKVYSHGGRNGCSGGTTQSAIESTAKEYGLKTDHNTSGFDWAADKAKTCPVVISVHNVPACGKSKSCQQTRKCPFTGNQHFIVITGNNNGVLSINDPAHGGATITLADLKAKCTYGTGATQICQ